MYLHIFRRAIEQLDIAKSDGDSAYLLQLLYMGELLTKFTTVALCAAICDDSDRHRYAVLYRLVRADGIGAWSQAMDEIVNGPSSRLLSADIEDEKIELTNVLQPILGNTGLLAFLTVAFVSLLLIAKAFHPD